MIRITLGKFLAPQFGFYHEDTRRREDQVIDLGTLQWISILVDIPVGP